MDGTSQTTKWMLIVVFLFGFQLAGCERSNEEPQWRNKTEPVPSHDQSDLLTLTLGDIDPDTPTNRLRKIRPLADHIAGSLEWDTSRVKVRIARSIEEMSTMLKDGRVDMFIDSIYPSMLVQHAAKSDFVLESLVDGNRAYEGLIVAAKDGGMVSLSDLDGLTLALQERYSTSGFLLPAALLVEEGFEAFDCWGGLVLHGVSVDFECFGYLID